MPRRICKIIDLFSGAGGLAQGFVQASDAQFEFRPVFAVEVDTAAAASYAVNFKHKVFVGSIEDLDLSILPRADLVIGGPPCQGFSPLGKMSPTEHHSTLNSLWQYFFKVVKEVQPTAFVVENVPEFLKSEEFHQALKAAKRLGYHVDHGVRNAADFGVPQHRKRGFLVGAKNFIPTLPTPPASIKYKTVKDAIGDLLYQPPHDSFGNNGNGDHGRLDDLIKKMVIRPSALPDMAHHSVDQLHLRRNPTDLSLRRYRSIPRGGNRFNLSGDLLPECWRKKTSGSADVMGRLDWDKPAVTIRTEFFKPEKGRYLHPELHRPITHLEAAKLQTFPDSYILCGSRTQVAKQIGNAVPPLLAQAIARHLKLEMSK
jgi:DNA (cytosine-5)-methyltransferase 1